MIPSRTDVFVIGGGPAGLATAIAARLRGMSVVLADSAQPPIDKACGEGLMPDSFEALRQLGIDLDRAERSFAIHGIRFRGKGCIADAAFRRGEARGVRRTVLHPLLVARAEEVGVELLWGTRVTAIGDRVVRLVEYEVAATWIVGADGQHSHVREWAKLNRRWHEAERFGFRRHYRIAPWSDRVEVFWGPVCQIYVTPVHQEEVCLALLSRDPRLHLDDALVWFPELQDHLGNAPVCTRERGGVTPTRRLRQVCKNCVALVGDASGSVDAITGEGLSLAFVQGVALANALSCGNLASYAAAHRRIMQRPRFMAALMLLLDRWPALRRNVLYTFATRPSVFAEMLAMHVGQTGRASFLRDALAPLACSMLLSRQAFGTLRVTRIAEDH